MQDQPLYPDVQREIAMKLLKLRVEFYENAKPIADDSNLDSQILNQFKVPFRIRAQKSIREGETTAQNKVFLLQGSKNMNSDTEQWYAFPGFVTRLLQAGAPSIEQNQRLKSSMWRKEEKLDVRIIDVNEWKSLTEIDKMQLLSTLINTTASPQKTQEMRSN